MAHPTEFWLKLFGAFDPTEILAGERQSLYCEREQSPLAEMEQVLRPQEKPRRLPIAFFTGHRGSGKSSMLFRLRDHFNADYFVVYFNVNHNLDSARANLIDLLFLLGTAIFRAAAQENLAPNPALLEELAEQVYTITYKSEVAKKEALDFTELAKGLLVFTAGVVGAKVGEKLAEAVLKPFNLSSGVDEKVARDRTIEPQVQEILTRINLIIAEVELKAKKPLLVIVDDLDKIHRQEQAAELFLQSRALTAPLCRIIYTVPMLIYTSLEFGDAEQDARCFFLPNIRLYYRTNDTQHYPRGYNEMHEVVRKRLQTLGLEEQALFEPDALELLIEKSGGLMRLLIRLVESACRFAEREKLERIDETAARAAIDEALREYSRRLTTDAIKELKEVHQSKRPSTTRECKDLLHALLIVAYQNGSTWFDAHPILWDELR